MGEKYLTSVCVIDKFANSYQSVILKAKIRMDAGSYEDEPVYYCKRCLSLNIRQVPMMPELSYCDDCGAVDIGEASFEEWDEMHVEKYSCHFMDK